VAHLKQTIEGFKAQTGSASGVSAEPPKQALK